MKIRTLDYYGDFRCLCGACPDTCCAGWDVEIDKESREKYLRMEGPLGEKACRALKKEDGEWSFQLEGGRCPFLMDSGLCEMQANMGEAALSRTCRLFPRIPTELGGAREVSLSISCPEAARLLLERETPLTIQERDTDEAAGYNDIDGETYLWAMDERAALLGLAQDRSLPFPKRLSLCVDMAAEAERARRSGQDGRNILARYKRADFRAARAAELARPRRADRAWDRLLGELAAMERLTKRWDGMLEDMKRSAARPSLWDAPECEYENLLAYYLFRYGSETAYGGSGFVPVKLAAASLCLIGLLWQSQEAGDRAARIDLAHLYSREVENSQDNLDALLALLRGVSSGRREAMLALIGA